MVKALDAVPYKQRQWGHAAARHTINAKQKLGLGHKQKILDSSQKRYCHAFGEKSKNWQI